MMEIEKCKICQKDFPIDSEQLYWHYKLHQVKKEMNIPEQL